MTRHRDSIVAARQAPLRARFKRRPTEAMTVKRVRTVADASADPLHGRVLAVDHDGIEWAFGLDAKVGGYDDLPNPGHLLCAALGACLDSTLRMIADRLDVDLRRLQVDVVGDVDVRGCLAMEDTVRPGFDHIVCTVDLEADPATDPRRMQLLLAQAERLCVTLDTLRHGVPVDVSYTHGEGTSNGSGASVAT